jgi:hypothetical protein
MSDAMQTAELKVIRAPSGRLGLKWLLERPAPHVGQLNVVWYGANATPRHEGPDSSATWLRRRRAARRRGRASSESGNGRPHMTAVLPRGRPRSRRPDELPVGPTRLRRPAIRSREGRSRIWELHKRPIPDAYSASLPGRRSYCSWSALSWATPLLINEVPRASRAPVSTSSRRF